MDNNLDKSWSDNLLDGSLGKVYLLGASDFQNRAIDQLRSDSFFVGDFKKGLLLAIEIIKNLKK